MTDWQDEEAEHEKAWDEATTQLDVLLSLILAKGIWCQLVAETGCSFLKDKNHSDKLYKNILFDVVNV